MGNIYQIWAFLCWCISHFTFCWSDTFSGDFRFTRSLNTNSELSRARLCCIHRKLVRLISFTIDYTITVHLDFLCRGELVLRFDSRFKWRFLHRFSIKSDIDFINTNLSWGVSHLCFPRRYNFTGYPRSAGAIYIKCQLTRSSFSCVNHKVSWLVEFGQSHTVSIDMDFVSRARLCSRLD